MTLDPAPVAPCDACEDAGPCPGRYWCATCDGDKVVSEVVRGYPAQLVPCEECNGKGSFVCEKCEGTGDEPETREKAMADKSKMTNEEVAAVVDSEGLGYAIEHYMSADSIEDPVLAARWCAAKEALSAVRDCLMPDDGAAT